MAFIDTFEAEFDKVKSGIQAELEKLTGQAEVALQQEINVLKADKASVIADVNKALEQAKASALAAVQADAPEAAAEASKALDLVEQAILAALGAHMVG